MATQTARYYSEGGRATKRQKTDNDGGMATVSNTHVWRKPYTLSSLFWGFSESLARFCDLARKWRELAARPD